MAWARSDDDRAHSAFLAVERPQFFPSGPWHVYEFSGALPYFSYRLTKSADPDNLYDDIAVALDIDRNINTGLPSVWVRYLTISLFGRTNMFCTSAAARAITAPSWPSSSVRAVR